MIATSPVPLPSALTVPSNTPSVQPASSNTSASPFGAPAIIGIVIGAVGFLTLMILAIWFLANKRKVKKQERYQLYTHAPTPAGKNVFRAELETPNQAYVLPTGEKYAMRTELNAPNPALARPGTQQRVELP